MFGAGKFIEFKGPVTARHGGDENQNGSSSIVDQYNDAWNVSQSSRAGLKRTLVFSFSSENSNTIEGVFQAGSPRDDS